MHVAHTQPPNLVEGHVHVVATLIIGTPGPVTKPAIAPGCDPIPFRTWKSNLVPPSCY